ncbi:CDP-alcohol phosphatidyltransferase family protein [Lichenihabitans sp. PAMC28606]|uniref:CDP-alcohol phosphatidyltransferase family protein n=1 Tax=Lichenihabitans TaxID=2723776 RepID=UPI0010384533|nr:MULTISPECIES: CDP-alcohol phosphatidyltransferase family protein [Lichenihabitans]UDL95217.1 CDP-alcohol phosphatidyltransferase family protein [Lichenihabitans sp. PAMC28606]
MNRSKIFASLPNLITVGRLFLVPLVIELISDRRWMQAFAVFLVAGLSDAVDGYLAKRFDLRTELGAYLDPIADKALLVSIYIALAFAVVIPNWLAIIVVSRDLMIVGAVLVAAVLDKPVPIRPLPISKLNTTAQIIFAAGVLGMSGFGADLGVGFQIALATVAALTVASAGAYLAQWLEHMSA